MVTLEDYVHDELHRVYRLAFKLQCEFYFQELSTAMLWTRETYSQYLKKQVYVAVMAGMEGKLTPQLLAMKDLRRIVENHPSLKHSMLSIEPGLIYKWATVIPVKIDLDTFRFGYILSIDCRQ